MEKERISPYRIEYQDIESNSVEAFQDTNDSQYRYLTSHVYKLLGKAEN